jgi:hypothetical protein
MGPIETLLSIDSFFTAHKDTVAALTGFAGVLSLLIAIRALAYTAQQIIQGTNVTKATKIYEIQKDAREAARIMLAQPDVAKEILGLPNLSQGFLVKAQAGQLFNLYKAIFLQRQYGVLDGRVWQLFVPDIQDLLASKPCRDFWESKKGTRQYHPEYVALLNGLIANLATDAKPSTEAS